MKARRAGIEQTLAEADGEGHASLAYADRIVGQWLQFRAHRCGDVGAAGHAETFERAEIGDRQDAGDDPWTFAEAVFEVRDQSQK